MKKRLFAVLMAALLGTCAVPAYADTPETVNEAASPAETAEDTDETMDEESLTMAETVVDNETANEAEAPSVDAEISEDEDAPTVVADASETIPSDESSTSVTAESDVTALESVDETELVGAAVLPTADAKIATGIYYIESKLDQSFILGTAGKSDLIRANIELQ